jgi:hypothetical protein
MATNYTVDLYDAERTEVKDSGSLTFTGAATVIPATLNQVSPVGTITSGTLPNLGAWVSGTAKVNPVARDITAYVEVVGDGTNNAGTCAIAISPDNSTYTTLGTVAIAAGINNLGVLSVPVPVRLPNGWYIKLTFTATRITVAASFYA